MINHIIYSNIVSDIIHSTLQISPATLFNEKPVFSNHSSLNSSTFHFWLYPV